MNLLRLALLLAIFNTSAHAQQIRIAAANLLRSSTGAYNDEGLRIISGLKADVVLIQQWVYKGGTYASFVSTTLGSTAESFRGSGTIPTGILSRYPIVDSGEWTDSQTPSRAFSWAKIDIPGDKFLWAVSVHFVTTSASNRNAEATALVAQIQAKIPAGDYLAIGGDLNSDTVTEALFSTLGAVVSIPASRPVDQASNSSTNAQRTKPYDHVLFSPGLEALKTATVVGSNSFANGLVVDTRVYTPLADLAPAQQDDASLLDHLPVLRDFSIAAAPIRIIAASFTLSPAPAGNITFSSSPGGAYQVEASSTLNGSDWQTLGTITPSSGATTSFQIIPSNPSSEQVADSQFGIGQKRFYRISR